MAIPQPNNLETYGRMGHRKTHARCPCMLQPYRYMGPPCQPLASSVENESGFSSSDSSGWPSSSAHVAPQPSQLLDIVVDARCLRQSKQRGYENTHRCPHKFAVANLTHQYICNHQSSAAEQCTRVKRPPLAKSNVPNAPGALAKSKGPTNSSARNKGPNAPLLPGARGQMHPSCQEQRAKCPRILPPGCRLLTPPLFPCTPCPSVTGVTRFGTFRSV